MDFRVDLLNRICLVGGRMAPQLTHTELKLLVCLLGAKGKSVTRQRLLTVAWGFHPESSAGMVGATRRVDMAVARLRAKLAKARPIAWDAIKVQSSNGYSIKSGNVRWMR